MCFLTSVLIVRHVNKLKIGIEPKLKIYRDIESIKKNMSFDETNPDGFERTLPIASAADCTYTSCYCEENVWQLCKVVQERCEEELENCYCVFISNSNKAIPLWCQRSSKRDDGLVIWDYHVIFIHRVKDGSMVYDLDTQLDFPCSFSTYTERGIHSCDELKPEFQRYFRVITAGEFISTFASDRSHMVKDGEWLKPPPPYPCIKTEASTNNIQDFISMESTVGVGRVMKYRQFCDFFTHDGCSRR